MNGTILAIESSGDSGGAAVLRDGNVLAEYAVPAPRSHGAQLMPCIDKALVQAKITRQQIDCVAVNCGPGSYTGLRIGIATAAAIGFALDMPVVGVPCFDVMALQYASIMPRAATVDAELWPVLDARREEVMTATFRVAGGALSRATEDKLLSPEALCEAASPRAIVFGGGLAAYPGKWDQSKLTLVPADFATSAVYVGVAAWRRLARVQAAAQIPRTPVQPRYFRVVTAKTIEERTRQIEAGSAAGGSQTRPSA